jgi:glycosyltransferase involved in cell wall biosynthesis
MAKIKIIYILNGLAAAGVEKVTIDICNHLDKERFEPYIIVLSNKYTDLRSEILPSVWVKILPFAYTGTSNFSTLFRQYKQLKKLFSEINPDIIHVSLYEARLYMAAYATKKQASSLLFVKTEHSRHHALQSTNFRAKIGLFIEKKAFKLNPSCLISVSESVYQISKKLFENETQRMLLIENGIDTKKFNRLIYNVSKQQFGIPDNAIVFVCTGNLGWIKDHSTLLKAWEIAVRYFLEKPISIRLILIGEGPERSNITSFIEKNHLTNTVILTGNIKNVPEYLAISDVGVLTSISEGLSLALIEKMMMKLPLIVSDIESNRILVNEHENGLLFPVGDECVLAQHIIYMAENQEKRKRMGEKGYEKAVRNFSLDRMIKNYEDFYCEILSEQTNKYPFYTTGYGYFERQTRRYLL